MQNFNLLKLYIFILMIFSPMHLFAESITRINISEEQKKELLILETRYNEIKVVKSQFLQTDNLGNKSSGWFIIQKPGKARIEYKDLPIRLIANNTSLLLQDISRKQKSFIPLRDNPFSYLLKEKISFFEKDITITELNNSGEIISLTMVSTESPYMGNIKLFFLKETKDLIKWQIKDAKGIVTEVYLVNPTLSSGKIMNSNIFNQQRVLEIDFNDIKLK